jgi:putative transcriptional regulator
MQQHFYLALYQSFKLLNYIDKNKLSERVGITMANLSILKNGKAKAIRLSTLEAICKALECQPGDILEYQSDEDIQGS